MSTYSANTFVFDLQMKRKLHIKNHNNAVCGKPYGPCFGVEEFYFKDPDIYVFDIHDIQSKIHLSGSINAFFARTASYFRRNMNADVEVYYRV